MDDFRCWIALAVLGLGACSGGSDEVSQQPPAPGVAFTVQRILAGLPAFSSPVAMLQAPGDSTR